MSGAEMKEPSPEERAAEILARAAMRGLKKPEEAAKALVFDAAASAESAQRFDLSRLVYLCDAIRREAVKQSLRLQPLEQALLLLAQARRKAAAKDPALLSRIEALLRQADEARLRQTPGGHPIFPP